MGLATETSAAVVSEVVFLRRELNKEGDKSIFYFQSAVYTPKHNKKESARSIIENFEPDEITEYQGNLKFTIPNNKLKLARHRLLADLVGGEDLILEFSVSPQYFSDADKSYARMSIISARLPKKSNSFIPTPPSGSKDAA